MVHNTAKLIDVQMGCYLILSFLYEYAGPKLKKITNLASVKLHCRFLLITLLRIMPKSNMVPYTLYSVTVCHCLAKTHA